ELEENRFDNFVRGQCVEDHCGGGAPFLYEGDGVHLPFAGRLAGRFIVRGGHFEGELQAGQLVGHVFFGKLALEFSLHRSFHRHVEFMGHYCTSGPPCGGDYCWISNCRHSSRLRASSSSKKVRAPTPSTGPLSSLFQFVARPSLI